LSIKAKNRTSKNAEKELSKKMGLFDKLSDECLACQLAFNKKDKEMVTSWYVIVREKQNQVNLYCPSCWQNAVSVVEEVKNDQSDS
jgi:hypothetical protein